MRTFLFLVSFGLLAVSKVLSVTDESHEPSVAIWCGKINKYKDLSSNQWLNDPDNNTTCSDDKHEILQFCKKSYPTEDVRNIVEANDEETIDKWCSPGSNECSDKKSVVVYRCLVGEFEADGLMVPTGCHFLHLHNEQKCQGHDEWKEAAKEKCESIKMDMGDGYGMLIPCALDKFEGVEFICCNKTKENIVDKTFDVVDGESTEVVETMESLVATLTQYVKPVSLPQSVECDRDQFHERRENMEEKHRQSVSEAVQKWEETNKHYTILKNDDPQQATGMITDAMERFKKTITVLEDQATLERERLREEQHECIQIDINIKKRVTLKNFLDSIKADLRDPKTIIDNIKKFVRLSQHDRYHNLRFFEHIRKDNPKKAEDMRQTLTDHLKMINERVNQTMNLLYKVPEIARHYRFILPEWAPKPAVPTTPSSSDDRPAQLSTDLANSLENDYQNIHDESDFNSFQNPFYSQQDPTDAPTTIDVETANTAKPGSPTEHPVKSQTPAAAEDHTNTVIYTTQDPPESDDDDDDDDDNDEDKIENEHHVGMMKHQTWKGPKSRTTFAAIIGLCCGALIVMIVIIVAMVVKRGRSPVTKTVLVDPECSADEEKRHLMNMQRSGYENPTYKFYDY